MNDIRTKADEMETVFEQIGPICLKHDDGRFGVLFFAAPNSPARLALFDRKDHFNPLDAIAEPNRPIEHYGDFEQIAADGWRID